VVEGRLEVHTSVISAAVMRGVSKEATKGNSIFHLLIVIVVVVVTYSILSCGGDVKRGGWPQSSRNELILPLRIPYGSAG
jgi:hypothetical protein